MDTNQGAKIIKKAKNKRKKQESLKINLSKTDKKMLDRYCLLNKTTNKQAVKKILHKFLSDNISLPEEPSKNQLDLFSSRETDIFDFCK
jgi:hypothetical protein